MRNIMMIMRSFGLVGVSPLEIRAARLSTALSVNHTATIALYGYEDKSRGAFKYYDECKLLRNRMPLSMRWQRLACRDFTSSSSTSSNNTTTTYSTTTTIEGANAPVIYTDPAGLPLPHDCLRVIPNVVSEQEEKDLVAYLVPLMSRKRYSEDHFDHVISRYREKELALVQPPPHIQVLFDRLRAIVQKECGNGIKFLPPHVIDLAKDGHIGPHVDSIKFSGGIVSSLSLLSSRVLRLTPDTTQPLDANVPRHSVVEVVIAPRTFYILSSAFRYQYNHEILGEKQEAKLIPRDKCPDTIDRRLSVMFRDELQCSRRK